MPERPALDAEARRGLILVAPPFLYAMALLAVPLVTLVNISLQTQVGPNAYDPALTLDRYAEVFTDPLYRVLFLRSVAVAGSATALTVLLAYPVAYFVSFHVRPERKSLWLFLITIPFWTSYLIRVYLWRVILGREGPVNETLINIGLIEEPLSWILYNPQAVVITLTHAFAPFAILPIYVALERIDRSLLEAARDLGESRLRAFLRVTLPLSVPGVVGAALIVFIPTIGDYVTPELVGGNTGRMLANWIQANFMGIDNRPQGAATAIVAMAAVALIAGALILATRRWLRVGRS